MTRYACAFENGDGDRREIMVDLTASDLDFVREHDEPQLLVEAFALYHAYRAAPEGFYHRVGGVAAVN
jgi:hypothetical protein